MYSHQRFAAVGWNYHALSGKLVLCLQRRLEDGDAMCAGDPFPHLIFSKMKFWVAASKCFFFLIFLTAEKRDWVSMSRSSGWCRPRPSFGMYALGSESLGNSSPKVSHSLSPTLCDSVSHLVSHAVPQLVSSVCVYYCENMSPTCP